jgi:MHS family proline/betaine transporter-like MFS transporter
VFIIGNSYLKTHAAKLPVLQHIQYIMSVSVILSIPVFGYLSDKFGRKPIVSFSLLAIFGLSLRFFQSLNTANSFNDVVIAILLAVSCGGYFAVAPTIIIESLPSKARCICFALFYTIPAAIVSGVTPYLTSWLIALNPIFITYAIIVLGIAAHLALRVFNEPVLTYKRLPKYSYEFLKP